MTRSILQVMEAVKDVRHVQYVLEVMRHMLLKLEVMLCALEALESIRLCRSVCRMPWKLLLYALW